MPKSSYSLKNNNLKKKDWSTIPSQQEPEEGVIEINQDLAEDSPQKERKKKENAPPSFCQALKEFSTDLKIKRIQNLRNTRSSKTMIPNIKARLWASRLMDEVYGRESIVLPGSEKERAPKQHAMKKECEAKAPLTTQSALKQSNPEGPLGCTTQSGSEESHGCTRSALSVPGRQRTQGFTRSTLSASEQLGARGCTRSTLRHSDQQSAHGCKRSTLNATDQRSMEIGLYTDCIMDDLDSTRTTLKPSKGGRVGGGGDFTTES